MITRVAAFLLAATLVLCVVAEAPASAAKTWPNLVVSRTGTYWTADLKRPLFDRHLRFVPGDAPQRTFYARNQSGERATLRVGIRVLGPNSWYASRQVQVSALVQGTWRPVRGTGGHGVAKFVVKDGQVVPVTLRVRLMPRSGSHTMDRRFTFQVSLRLTQLLHGG